MSVSVHLTFDGQCRKAMDTYCKLLGGEIVAVTTFGDTPDSGSVPADWQDKVIHATVTLGDITVAAADIPPERYQPASGFFMFADLDTPTEAKRVFDALADGGSVAMPFGETFWAKGFGVLTDRFGTPWEVNCSKDD